MKLNWNFQRGGETQSKQLSVGEVWIFPVTTQLLFCSHEFNFLLYNFTKMHNLFLIYHLQFTK